MTSPSHRALKASYKFLGIIAFIWAVLSSPLILLNYFTLWSWSKLVSFYCGKTYQILDGEDVMASIDEFQTNSIVNGLLTLKGMFTVETMQEIFATRVLEFKDKNGNLLLPKYSQRLVEHFDYWFWTSAQNFDINDHIRYFNEQPLKTEVELKQIVNEIINLPISWSKPLWEIIIIPCLISNENSSVDPEPKTVAVLRAHHAIGDGVSFLRVIMSQLSENTGEMNSVLEKAISNRQVKAEASFRNKLTTLLLSLYNIILIPAFLLRPFLIQEKHALHGPKLSGVVISNWTTHIKLQTIKDIKNSTSTTVNDVVMSCLAGAVRRCFLRKNVTPPKYVNIYIPVNLQGPNDALNNMNKLSYVMPMLPTGDMDCLARLKETKMIMDDVKVSPQIMANRLIFKYYGSVMPNSMIRILQSLSPCAFILSNLPGPAIHVSLGGHEVESVIPIATTRSSTGVGVIVISYGGYFSISTTMDSALVNDSSDAASLLKDIETEVNQLYTTAVKTTVNDEHNN